MRRVITISALLLSTVLFAQRPDIGGYPGAFTRFGTNAREISLGGALGADVNSGFLAITNPASVVYHRRREIGASYLQLPLGRSIQTLSFALALPPTAAASLSYIRAGDDDIEGRNSIGIATGKVLYSEQAIGLTFSNKLSASFSMGLTAKVLIQTLDEVQSRGFGIDLGLLYRRPSGLSAALKAENITGAYAWTIEEAQENRQYSEHLPRIFSAAVRLPIWHFTFYGQADGLAPEQGGMIPIYHVGIENRLGDQLTIRGGMNHLSPTIGGGLVFTLREKNDSAIDYAFSMGRASEGFGHIFSWVFTL